ncbi:MAG: dTDP-4-dehydrorhamnose reductase [Myxococcales bacterium]|nr:dTDP-4-dehydrorhamnose reductase [Myxococcales bacterium]
MKLLITGSNGQLGRALTDTLADHRLVLRDLPELDVAEPDPVAALLDAERPDWVLNAAAYTAVDGAESDRAGAERGNVTAPRVLAEATAAREIPLVHVSTDYVFDGETDRPYVESDPPSPRTVYGHTKLAGEEAVRAANPQHFVVRTAWLYSTGGSNFALTMVGAAERGAVRVVDDQTGSPTYAPHLARGIAQLVGRSDWGTVHMANAGQTTWYGLTRALYAELGLDCEVAPCTTDEFPRPAERPRYSALATEREPAILLPSWEEGVRDFASDLRAARPARPA